MSARRCRVIAGFHGREVDGLPVILRAGDEIVADPDVFPKLFEPLPEPLPEPEPELPAPPPAVVVAPAAPAAPAALAALAARRRVPAQS